MLQRADAISRRPRSHSATYEAALGTAEGWHTHSGEMVSCVVEGAIRLERRDGQPATVTAGQSFIVPAGVPHRTVNTGTTSVRMVVTYFVEKDEALSTPAFPRN